MPDSVAVANATANAASTESGVKIVTIDGKEMVVAFYKGEKVAEIKAKMEDALKVAGGKRKTRRQRKTRR